MLVHEINCGFAFTKKNKADLTVGLVQVHLFSGIVRIAELGVTPRH
jgi:hypothetical protein